MRDYVRKTKYYQKLNNGYYELDKLEGENKNMKFLCATNKKKKNQIMLDVREMAYSDEKELEYEFKSLLLKQKLTTEIKAKYPGMFTYFKKDDNTFKVFKGKYNERLNEKVTSIQDSFSSFDDKDSDTRSEDCLDIKKIKTKNSNKMIAQYREEMGFSLIIEEMRNSHKPLIGHNGIYDIGFLYDQFIAPLPDTFKEFAEAWRDNFPETFDSKYITYKYQGKLFHNTHLGSLYKKGRKDKSLRNSVSYCIDGAPVYKRYQNESEELLTSLKVAYAHEAGFDAYMAGGVFLSTAKYREIGAMMESK